jgi:hypothetical protein
VSVITTRKKNKRTTVSLAQPPSNRSRKSICSVLDALHLWQFVVITVDLHSFLSTYQSVCLAPHHDRPFFFGRYRWRNAALETLFVFPVAALARHVLFFYFCLRYLAAC